MKTTKRRALQMLSCAVPALLGSRLSGQAAVAGSRSAKSATNNGDNIQFPMRKLQPDGVHYAIQVLGNPVTAWTDQIQSNIGFTQGGSRHYSRGVTPFPWSLA